MIEATTSFSGMRNGGCILDLFPKVYVNNIILRAMYHFASHERLIRKKAVVKVKVRKLPYGSLKSMMYSVLPPLYTP